MPPHTADFASIDHRRAAAYAPGDLPAYIRAGWDLGQNVRTHIEAVHRLNNLGAIVTHAARGTSQEGFDAEWRGIDILTVEGELISRSEVFDEVDLNAALARFDELAESKPKPRLANEATRIGIQLAAAYNRRDSDAYLSVVSPDGLFIDRRKGLHSESEASLQQNLRAVFEVSPHSFEMTWEPLATRGSHLSLAHEVWRDCAQEGHPIAVELLTVMEASDAGLLCVGVAFDPDDIDAAFDELDTRYRNGEAAAHAPTWSVVSGAYATLNSRQVPAATPDCVTVDRRGGGIAHEGNVDAYLNATWDVAPDVTMRIETVHQLTDLGAVVTFTSCGTSQNGFSALWRGINVLTVEGDLISRGEIFDETDLDAALARFDKI
jgi:ketosteroid isomerase-like protein